MHINDYIIKLIKEEKVVALMHKNYIFYIYLNKKFHCLITIMKIKFKKLNNNTTNMSLNYNSKQTKDKELKPNINIIIEYKVGF